MRKTARIFTSILLTLLLKNSSHSADFSYFESPYFDAYVVSLSGQIVQGDSRKFSDVVTELVKQKPISSLVLDSPGGDVFEAFAIGEIASRLKIDTQAPAIIEKDKQCASACFYIWASGVTRLGSKIAIHRPYFEKTKFKDLSVKEADKLYSSMLEEVSKKLLLLNITPALIEKMEMISSNKIVYLTPSELGQLRYQASFSEYVIARCGNLPSKPISTILPYGMPKLPVGFKLDVDADLRCYHDVVFERVKQASDAFR